MIFEGKKNLTEPGEMLGEFCSLKHVRHRKGGRNGSFQRVRENDCEST
jgi:transposase-like protein